MIPETITPPRIVPPSATPQIGIDFNGSIYSNLTITGYTLEAAYFGP